MACPLISASDLVDRLDSGHTAVLDVRWDLAQGARRDLFAAGHIPDAVFVDLAAQLAGTPAPDGSGGRHPLPAPADFVAAMRTAGVFDDRSVVVYDGTGGLAAARAWWLLRHYGHSGVTVLDGGLDAWRAGGGRLAAGSS
ncbi:MAG: rhodanese-like domain-containing protein, partial [Actinomycetota bacterium]|nr:rhodanese-like domain-containing protein [Actinomycetota bacterium]